ncbi:MAG: hypothetical protein C0501_09965 [Isosphaera sp.]|nr:hypothetical protein [Isosphaera sp.]
MTPRRILMLVGGLLACAAGYAVYARVLGRFDGLPVLPPRMLVRSDGEFRPQPRATSPTIELLRQAFGENAPEADSDVYRIQLKRPLDDRGGFLVLASGQPPANPGSTRVPLSPFSIAVFGRPRPAHLRRPGEVPEVTTVHADRAVLEFDRVIETAADMNAAKIVRVELVSDPEQAVRDGLGRRGLVHLTTNQRSADPDRQLTVRTVGPVFYRDPKVPPGAPPPTGPDLWTDAPVEIVDRGNLPRCPGHPVAAAPGEVRTPAAVAAVLAGQRLPPPTVTAVGMRVYMDGEKPKEPAAKKDGSAGFGSVRRVEFLEQVVMNLWAEAGQGLVGAGDRGPAAPEGPGLAAGGGLVAGARAARALGRDLVRVETRGPFAYDAEKNLARFDVLPVADPNLPNDVQVTKVSARPGVQTLFSQVLELEFNGPPPAPKPGDPAPPPGGAKFKRLHAWTYTPGRFLTLSSDADQLEAHGQDLVRDEAEGRTTLTGAPLYAVQKKNVLTAGGAKNPATLVYEPEPGSAPADRRTRATVLGSGRAELLDPASGSNTVTAAWQTSLVQTRERANDRDLELYTLTDGASFADEKADFWLKGRVLKLWLARPAPGEPVPADGGSRARPHRLQAVGGVTGHSADLDIEQADQLNTYFQDVAPASAPPAPAPAAGPPGPPAAGPAPPAVAPPAPKEQERKKPPTRLRARTVDTTVDRVPRPPAGQAGEAGLKYELKTARCEGMVNVQQDPADPAKGGGTKILGSLLMVDGSPEGNVMTVFGWDERPGQVHNDGTSLIGPKVVLDQVHNWAAVEGRGALTIPASSDLGGAPLRQAEPVVVQFRDGMKFSGAEKVADFFGKVTATQGGSWVICHRLQVRFDRPVYFSPANRPPAPPGKKDDPADKPKVDRVYCYPAPADAADHPREREVWYTQVDRDPETGKPVRRQQLVASELDLKAQARDADGEPYRLAQATGPGVFRVWQPGAKDDPAGPARPPGAAPTPAETEMKLTVVEFSGRMTAKDKGRAYQEAAFTGTVRVVHLPTDDPDLEVRPPKLPPAAVLLTCNSKMVVWTHRRAGEPARQHLEAHGNAYLQNDEYDGWGDTISHDGRRVVFEAKGQVQAQVKSRFGGTDQTGRRIIYDRAANRIDVEGSTGGTFVSPPPKK